MWDKLNRQNPQAVHALPPVTGPKTGCKQVGTSRVGSDYFAGKNLSEIVLPHPVLKQVVVPAVKVDHVGLYTLRREARGYS